MMYMHSKEDEAIHADWPQRHCSIRRRFDFLVRVTPLDFYFTEKVPEYQSLPLSPPVPVYQRFLLSPRTSYGQVRAAFFCIERRGHAHFLLYKCPSQELPPKYLEQDTKQGPSSQSAERAGSGLQAFSSSKELRGLSVPAQVRV